jgi:hypothetical protein
MPHLNLLNATLHYQQWGEGPCIAFLHGSGGNHLSWWQQIPALSRSYRCLALDLRGYGFSRTETSPLDAAVFGDDLLALLDHLERALPRRRSVARRPLCITFCAHKRLGSWLDGLVTLAVLLSLGYAIWAGTVFAFDEIAKGHAASRSNAPRNSPGPSSSS